MRKKLGRKMAVVSLGYWFGSHSLGLLMHPYQSVRRMVREEVFVPLVMLPSVVLMVWWMVGVVVANFNVLATLGLGLVAVELERRGPTQIVLSLAWLWGVVFLLLWQVMLGYLYRRFRGLRRG